MQRKSILNRSKRSDDLELPRNFEVGQAKAEGDCFFDSFRQGLKQIGIEVTVDELRRECAEFARNNPPGWFISAVVNKSKDVDNVDKYVERIARDEWGDSDIEGRILCQKYNVRLHIAEKQREGVWVHSIVDGEGLRSAGNIDYDQDNLIHIANRGHDHFEPILRRQEVQHGQQPIVQPPENQLPNEREHQTQDFELVKLLFEKELTGAETPPRSNFETFEERFQSFIDQMPSYLHSVEKEGFFTNLLFGMFSILLDTKIAKGLNVKKIYFSFDTAKTLKVVAIKSDQINDDKGAMNNIVLFSFSELHNDEKSELESENKFTSGELEDILKKFNAPDEAQRIKDEVRDKMRFKSIKIRKEEGRISVEEKFENVSSDSTAGKEFYEIEKGLWNNPENDIAGLADPDKQELKKFLTKVFKKISEIYSKYKGLLKHGISEGGKHFREAAHHGLITGILMDFRYGYNVRINIEQLAGRGYADIVLLVLGPNRKMNRVPVIVELKAARYEDVEKLKKLLEKREALTEEEEREKSAIEQRIEKSLDDGLMQALNYAKGFDLNAMPFLTFSNDVFVMSLNLDSEQVFKMDSHQLIRMDSESTIMWLLGRVSLWNGQEDTENDLKNEMKVVLERVYYTFPSVGEKQGGSFAAFLLGEFILADKFKQSSLERCIFLYGEYQLKRQGRDKFDVRPVTTFVLTKTGKNEVFIFHIKDGNVRKFKDEAVPINSLEQSKITEVYVDLDEKRKTGFFNIDKIARYESLSDYKEGREPFQGELKDIPYPEGLREAFNGALDLELRKFSTDKFSRLFSKIGEAIFPVRSLVGIEANFRQVLNGAFRTYGSLLRQAKDSKIIVLAFTEVQYGEGKRVDIVIRTSEIDSSGKVVRSTIVSLELKGPREGASVETLIKEANNQINRKVGKFVRSKAIIEDGEIKEVGVVWNNQAVDGRSLIVMSSKDFIISDVVHSSIRGPQHVVMGISPDRTSSQQFRNDFPHTSLSEGIVRISDPQRPHGENSFPGLSTDAHRDSSPEWEETSPHRQDNQAHEQSFPGLSIDAHIGSSSSSGQSEGGSPLKKYRPSNEEQELDEVAFQSCSSRRRKRDTGKTCIDSRDEESAEEKKGKEELIKELFDSDEIRERIKNIEFYDQLYEISEKISRGETISKNSKEVLVERVKDINLDSIDPEIRGIVVAMKNRISRRSTNKVLRDIIQKPEEVAEKIIKVEEGEGLYRTVFLTKGDGFQASNPEIMGHLNRIGKVSGWAMEGMMYKNLIGDILSDNLEGVAINLGFIAGGPMLSKAAEAASAKGLKLVSEGKVFLGKSLRIASPFLAHFTTGFIVYDLVNQVKAYKAGNKDAMVGIVGDSVVIAVDVAEIGVEVAEITGVLEGVSSITGPIGAAIGAIVFIGTDIYLAVRTVEKEDKIIHLTGWEKFKEGWRASFHISPEQYIEELIGEKEVNNQLVKSGIKLLKRDTDIQRYVFPTGRSVVDSCRTIKQQIELCSKGSPIDGKCPMGTGIYKTYESEKCNTKIQLNLESVVSFSKKMDINYVF